MSQRCTALDQRRRRRAVVVQMLYKCAVLAGIVLNRHNEPMVDSVKCIVSIRIHINCICMQTIKLRIIPEGTIAHNKG